MKKDVCSEKLCSRPLCLVGTSKNRRVTGNVVAKRFGDEISGMPFIRPRNLKAMVRRELVVFISSKVCRHAKALVRKRFENQFKEDFMVLNNSVLGPKEANLGSYVSLMFEKKNRNEFPVFQKMYVYLAAIGYGFIVIYKKKQYDLIGVFLKELLKGNCLWQ